MLSHGVIEHLDVVEHILPSLSAGFVCLPADPFALDQVKEALGDRIIMTVPASAHRVLEVVSLEERGPFAGSKLRSLIGVDRHGGLRRE